MKWFVEVKAITDEGKVISCQNEFKRKKQCVCFMHGVNSIAKVVNYKIIKLYE